MLAIVCRNELPVSAASDCRSRLNGCVNVALNASARLKSISPLLNERRSSFVSFVASPFSC